MSTLKLVGGFVIFVPLFLVVMVLPAKLTDRNRTGLAFLAWFAGFAALMVVITLYGKAVR